MKHDILSIAHLTPSGLRSLTVVNNKMNMPCGPCHKCSTEVSEAYYLGNNFSNTLNVCLF